MCYKWREIPQISASQMCYFRTDIRGASRGLSYSSTSFDHFASRPRLTPAITSASASDSCESLTSSLRCLLSLHANCTGSLSVSSGCSPFALAVLLAPTGGTILLSSFALFFSFSFHLSSLLCRSLGAILSQSSAN